LQYLKAISYGAGGLPPYGGIGWQQSYTAKELGEAIDFLIQEIETNQIVSRKGEK